MQATQGGRRVEMGRRQVDISAHVGQGRDESKEKVREWVDVHSS